MALHNGLRHNGTLVTPFVQGLLDEPDARSFAATASIWHLLAHSSVAVSHTGNTSETTLATVTVPAGSMGPNGLIRITTLWSYTNSANTKTLRVRFGGWGAKAIGFTTTASYQNQIIIRNVNSTGSQKAFSSGNAGVFETATVAPITNTIDTTVAKDITFTAELANSSETIKIESYIVELYYGA